MSIEEAILQEKELAKCQRAEAYSWKKEGWEKAFVNLTLGKEQEIRLRREEMARMSIEIAIGHEQIANWLQELKERREKESRGISIGKPYVTIQVDTHMMHRVIDETIDNMYFECKNCGQKMFPQRKEESK